MQNQNNVFELKAQARRLRTALAEMNVAVSHTASLNLIARAQGDRNWEALEAKFKVAEASAAQALVVEQADAQARHVFLRWMEERVYLTLPDLDDLDDLIYDIAGGEDASAINNEGVYRQLDMLMATMYRKKVSLEQEKVGLLELLTEKNIWSATPFRIPVTVSVCAGSAFEQKVEVDGLAWFAMSSYEEQLRLLQRGLSNNEVTDEVGLWLAQRTPCTTERDQLTKLLAYMERTQDLHPEVVGITVSISVKAVETYVQGTNSLTSEQSDVLYGELPY